MVKLEAKTEDHLAWGNSGVLVVWERFYDNRLRGLVKGAAANLPEITFSRVSPRFSGLFSVVGVGSLVVGPSQWSLKGFIGYAPDDDEIYVWS